MLCEQLSERTASDDVHSVGKRNVVRRVSRCDARSRVLAACWQSPSIGVTVRLFGVLITLE